MKITDTLTVLYVKDDTTSQIVILAYRRYFIYHPQHLAQTITRWSSLQFLVCKFDTQAMGIRIRQRINNLFR